MTEETADVTLPEKIGQSIYDLITPEGMIRCAEFVLAPITAETCHTIADQEISLLDRMTLYALTGSFDFVLAVPIIVEIQNTLAPLINSLLQGEAVDPTTLGPLLGFTALRYLSALGFKLRLNKKLNE